MVISMGKQQRDQQFIKTLAPQPRTNTELTSRKRALSVSDAGIAVAFLNGTKGSPAYERVFALHRELAEFEAMRESLHRQKQEREKARKEPVHLPVSPEGFAATLRREMPVLELETKIRVLHSTISKKLSSYSLTPILPCDLNSGICRFDAIPKAKRGPTVEVSDGSLTLTVTEAAVVCALARLAAAKELFKVRLCEMCREVWKVSERRIDRFCSQRCREKFRGTDEESRARHALAQRKHKAQPAEAQGKKP
jgi:hypothetical protein